MSRDEVFQSCYYDDLITEIFYKIKIRKQNKRPRQLYPGFSWINNEADEQGVSVYELSFGQNGKKLVRIREEDKDEIKSCIEKLLSNSDLNKMVSDYITLKDELDKNKNRSDFFQNIDNLYKKIYSDGEPLNRKGKCTLCPFELY